MPQVAHVIGVYALPAALDVTPSCFGKSFPVTIGTIRAKLTLPQIAWSGDDPHIAAPPFDAAAYERLKPHLTDRQGDPSGWRFWGNVRQYHPGRHRVLRAELGAVLLEFSRDPAHISYSDYLNGRGHPVGGDINQLFQTIDLWFERLRIWVETAVDQDADPFYSPLAPVMPGSGLHVLTVDGETISLPASASHIITTLSTYEPISLSLLRKLLRLVNAGATPSDAHLLLRDSRAELRRGRYRRAVIDAGSATEITLADFNNQATQLNLGKRPTLGTYTRDSRIATPAKLPANINSGLVDIRNDAIHQNRTPTRDEAVTAIALAKQVVDRLDPLPL